MTTLYDAMQSHIHKMKDSLYTSSVGTITKVNYRGDSIESINVRPFVASVYNSGEVIKKPILFGVPVLFPSGGGGVLSFPLQIGDTVLLVFSKDDIDSFISNTGNDVPKSNRKFSINDPVAIPCFYPTAINQDPNKENVELKFKESSIKITPEGDVIVNSKKEVTVEAATQININVPSVNINSQTITCSGDLTVSGNISVGEDIVTTSGVSLKDHVHSGVRAGTELSEGPNI